MEDFVFVDLSCDAAEVFFAAGLRVRLFPELLDEDFDVVIVDLLPTENNIRGLLQQPRNAASSRHGRTKEDELI